MAQLVNTQLKLYFISRLNPDNYFKINMDKQGNLDPCIRYDFVPTSENSLPLYSSVIPISNFFKSRAFLINLRSILNLKPWQSIKFYYFENQICGKYWTSEITPEEMVNIFKKESIRPNRLRIYYKII
jgi:hypothetical protein